MSRRACSLLLLPLALLACGPSNPGGRSLPRVRKDSAAIRSRALLELEGGLVFPDCGARPGPHYPCGLYASREAERAITERCADDARCVSQGYAALFAHVQSRAEDLGVELDAVDLRCGPACSDLRTLELEIVRTAQQQLEGHVLQALLRADSDEREALERAHESTRDFARAKGERDARVNAIFDHHRRALTDAARHGQQLPHATLCSPSRGCPDAHPCETFPGAALGLCAHD